MLVLVCVSGGAREGGESHKPQATTATTRHDTRHNQTLSLRFSLSYQPVGGLCEGDGEGQLGPAEPLRADGALGDDEGALADAEDEAAGDGEGEGVEGDADGECDLPDHHDQEEEGDAVAARAGVDEEAAHHGHDEPRPARGGGEEGVGGLGEPHAAERGGGHEMSLQTAGHPEAHVGTGGHKGDAEEDEVAEARGGGRLVRHGCGVGAAALDRGQGGVGQVNHSAQKVALESPILGNTRKLVPESSQGPKRAHTDKWFPAVLISVATSGTRDPRYRSGVSLPPAPWRVCAGADR